MRKSVLLIKYKFTNKIWSVLQKRNDKREVMQIVMQRVLQLSNLDKLDILVYI